MNPEINTTKPKGMRTFFIIWAGQVVSIVGSGLTGFALAVWIFQQTGKATPFALAALFATLPRVLISPIAGVVADRFPRRWIMILADSGNALVTLAVLIMLRGGDLKIWQIYLIVGIGSIFSGFQEPAYTASITMLVPKQHYARASGMAQMASAFESLVSPLLAGILFVAIGLPGIVLIDFVTYFFAVGALLFTRIPDPVAREAEQDEQRSVWFDLAFGWRYLRARVGLLGLLIYYGFVNYMVNGAFVLLGPLVLSFGSAATLGVVQTVMGVGFLVGSIVISTWGGPKRKIRGVSTFIGIAGLGLGVIGLQASAVVISTGMLMLAVMVPMASGTSQAIFLSKVEPSVQGRVFAMRSMVARSITPLAFLTAGPLADQVFEPLMQLPSSPVLSGIGDMIGTGPGRGVGLMFILASVLTVIVTGIAYASPRIRLIEDELPDVVVEAATEQEPGAVPAAATGVAAD